MSDIVDQIRSLGHWDVAIRPEPFVRSRLEYTALTDLIDRLTVRMRGWPVPFVDHRLEYLRRDDWIGQDIDAQVVAHLESWRMFTSGQFSQLRVISADYRIGNEGTRVPRGAASVIEVWEILFYLTELVELAARLSLSEGGSPSISIDARLQGTQGRQLVAGSPARDLVGVYQAQEPSLSVARRIDRDHLLSEPRTLAVEMSRELMLKFGFEASVPVLTEYQQELTHGD
jgi:hypothetical protein